MGKFMCFLYGVDSDEMERAAKYIYEVGSNNEYEEGHWIASVNFHGYTWWITKAEINNGQTLLLLENDEDDTIEITIGRVSNSWDVRNDLVGWCMRHKKGR